MYLGEYMVEPRVTALFEFTEYVVSPIGMISLPLSLGKGYTKKTQIFSFIVVEAPSSYNIILGRPSMAIFMAVASTLHQNIKFLVGIAVEECSRRVKGRSKNIEKPL